MSESRIQPRLLRKMTVRAILEQLQQHGPLSRADLSRNTGISAPTVSKAVSDLLGLGFLEETVRSDNALGRPGMKLRLSTVQSRVIGVVLDSERCEVTLGMLDGTIDPEVSLAFAPAGNFQDLMVQVTNAIQAVRSQGGFTFLGIGISAPGLISQSSHFNLLVPSMETLANSNVVEEIAASTGLAVQVMQESRALCLAERLFGEARGIQNYVMMDAGTSLSLGIINDGELFNGHDGLAGQLGHVTVDLDGRLCGCGNRGCLGVMSTDRALSASVVERVGRQMTVDQMIDEARSGILQIDADLVPVLEYLAVGIAAAVNLLNPTTLFLHCRMQNLADNFIERLTDTVRRRALQPMFDACKIRAASVSRSQGAIAAIVHHLTQSVGPRLS